MHLATFHTLATGVKYGGGEDFGLVSWVLQTLHDSLVNLITILSFVSTGLHHWIVNFLAQDDRRDEAIVLIDPDFLFMNKFEFPGKTPPVLPGKPVAAKYGLGGQVRMHYGTVLFHILCIRFC